MAENYPNTTGHEASFADIELQWAGKKYTGFKEFNTRHTRDTNHAEGSQFGPIGNTRGSYTGGEGDIMVTLRTWGVMLTDMGNGYMSKVFDINQTVVPEGGVTYTKDAIGCTITEVDEPGSRGPDPLYVKLSFKCLRVVSNGVEP